MELYSTYKNPAPVRLGYSAANGRTDGDPQAKNPEDRSKVFAAFSN